MPRRSRRTLLPGIRSPLLKHQVPKHPVPEFHVLAFDNERESAHFVKALLDGLRRSSTPSRRAEDARVVWAELVPLGQPRKILYASHGALSLARELGLAVVSSGVIPASELPQERVLVV